MSQYRETLHRWAARHVPEGAEVVYVSVTNDPGYCYSSWTYEDPHVDVDIRWRKGADEGTATADVENLGEILTQLFAIEEGDRR